MAPTKTTYMMFKGLVKNKTVKVDGHIIMRSRSSRYLGVMLDEKRNFAEHLETIYAKSMRAMNRIISIGQRGFHLPMTLIHKYHQTILLSIIGYGASAWTLRLKKKVVSKALRRLQKNILLRLTRVYRITSTDLLCVALRICPLDLQVREGGVLYWLKKSNISKVEQLTRRGVATANGISIAIQEKWQREWDNSTIGELPRDQRNKHDRVDLSGPSDEWLRRANAMHALCTIRRIRQMSQEHKQEEISDELDEIDTSKGKFCNVKVEEHFYGEIEPSSEEFSSERSVIKNEQEYLTQLDQKDEDYIPFNEHTNSDNFQDPNSLSSEMLQNKNIVKNTLQSKSFLDPKSMTELTENIVNNSYSHKVGILKQTLLTTQIKINFNGLVQKNSPLYKTIIVRGEQRRYKCESCEMSFNLKRDIFRHSLTHSGLKSYKCEECGKCFKQKSDLLRHSPTHSGLKQFACKECGKCFKVKSYLLRHNLTHSGFKQFKCAECGKCFTRKSYLFRHTYIHSELKQFKCEECGKCCKHLKDTFTHSGLKQFKCEKCCKCFTHKSSLFRHTCIHSELKQFKCVECGKCFKQKSDLLRHNLTHSELKQFTCEECGKCFKVKSYLLQHILTHSALQFNCKKCCNCFTQNSSLFRNTCTHSELKQFTCEECGKCFKRKNNLLRHILTHSGLQQLFKCDECDKGFSQRSHLLRHTLTHSELK
uniref:Uncharacterized protein n=1 Tax=Timema monikensis TaxID=170555 RepID=A0A7R9EFS1_9NEOP|nr:unnamed protein product [Timema monikensis]